LKTTKQLSPGQLKQEILKIYNTVNQEIFGIGIRSQRVEVMEGKVLIFATHKRITPLKILDESQRLLTRIFDNAIIEANKAMLAERVEEQLQLPVEVIFKDYDPRTEQALTVIIFKDNHKSWSTEAGNKVPSEETL
jgi:hypothetical protein